MADPIRFWPELRAFALSFGLPKVEEAVSWGNPTLKAHGKLWCWWSPYTDAALFKGTIQEREALHAADPETFPKTTNGNSTKWCCATSDALGFVGDP